MQKKLCPYMIFGFLFTIAVGFLMHYAYAWSGNSFFVGLFAPVNESTWEHMKLLFFPMLVAGIFLTCRLQKDYPDLPVGMSVGLLSGIWLIPVLFYTYTGILGFHVLWMDIAVFLLSALTAFLVVCRVTKNDSLSDYKAHFIFLVVLMTLCFFFFTRFPPSMGLFQIPKE